MSPNVKSESKPHDSIDSENGIFSLWPCGFKIHHWTRTLHHHLYWWMSVFCHRTCVILWTRRQTSAGFRSRVFHHHCQLCHRRRVFCVWGIEALWWRSGDVAGWRGRWFIRDDLSWKAWITERAETLWQPRHTLIHTHTHDLATLWSHRAFPNHTAIAMTTYAGHIFITDKHDNHCLFTVYLNIYCIYYP